MQARVLTLALAVSLNVTATALAAAPSLGSITPRGAQRGTDAVLSFNGGNLSDAKEVFFYSAGFTVTKLEIVNNNQVKATVKIAADCQLGEHAARVRTASGISELRNFFVGALPSIDEKEPNSDLPRRRRSPLT
jgi:hypothetical protein